MLTLTMTCSVEGCESSQEACFDGLHERLSHLLASYREVGWRFTVYRGHISGTCPLRGNHQRLAERALTNEDRELAEATTEAIRLRLKAGGLRYDGAAASAPVDPVEVLELVETILSMEDEALVDHLNGIVIDTKYPQTLFRDELLSRLRVDTLENPDVDWLRGMLEDIVSLALAAPTPKNFGSYWNHNKWARSSPFGDNPVAKVGFLAGWEAREDVE